MQRQERQEQRQKQKQENPFSIFMEKRPEKIKKGCCIKLLGLPFYIYDSFRGVLIKKRCKTTDYIIFKYFNF